MLGTRSAKGAVILATVAAVVAAGGCAAQPRNAPGTDTVAAQGPGTDAYDLDSYMPTDAAFFEQLRAGEAALLARPPATLRGAAAEATAVVTARVGDVMPTRTLGGASLFGVELVDITVVRGELEDPTARSIVVEFLSLGPEGATEKTDRMRGQLPRGVSVWFLRWQGTPPPVRKPEAPPWPPRESFDARLYGLVHLYGIFIQGPDKVQAPTANPQSEGFQREAVGLSRLSQVVSAVRPR